MILDKNQWTTDRWIDIVNSAAGFTIIIGCTVLAIMAKNNGDSINV